VANLCHASSVEEGQGCCFRSSHWLQKVSYFLDVKSTANTSCGQQVFVKWLCSPSSPKSASQDRKTSKQSISSTASCLHSLQGASRTTGGLLCGKVAGNVFNMADDM